MKDGNREKLRQLPRERKLYLLQQNQHIKENRTVDSALRESMPTSNSSSSLFPPKALRQKSAMKRSETSSRLIFNNNNTNNTNGKIIKMDNSASYHSFSSAQSEDSPNVDETPRLPSDSSSQNNNSSKEVMDSQQSSLASPMTTTFNKSKMNKKKSTILPVDTTVISTAKSSENKEEIPSSPKSPNVVDKRAATYKYARRNLSPPSVTSSSNRSKVGSMILEFDALAHKLEDTTSDESTAWLLLDNKTLPRNYNNNSIQQLNNSHHHPSVNHLFPTCTTSPKPLSPTPGNESSASSTLLTNSYAYQSLTRKDGSRLASMAGSTSNTSPIMEEKRSRDRNSPYYYVERLRSR